MDNILNNEFRDMSAAACYPFVANSTMTGDRLTLPTDFILDAVLYPSGSMIPPFFLYSITGISEPPGSVKLEFRDSRRVTLGTATMLIDKDSALIFDDNGFAIGVVVCGPGYGDVADKLKNFICIFQAETTQLDIGRCFIPAVLGCRMIKAGSVRFSGDVALDAVAGIHFAKDGDLPDEISVNLYGELRTPPSTGAGASINSPIKSINGQTMKHAWIFAYPGVSNPSTTVCSPGGSELRVKTREIITIGKTRDFTYGD